MRSIERDLDGERTTKACLFKEDGDEATWATESLLVG